MNLLIDDMRDIDTYHAIARSAEAGKRLIALGGWKLIGFDHDLGEEETGYDVLKWAIESDFLMDDVEEVVLVTSNPVGRQNMEFLLVNNGYKKVTPTYFKKA